MILKKISLGSIFIILFTVLFYLNRNTSLPKIKLSPEAGNLKLNKNIIVWSALGYKRLFSAFFWTETLLNSDHVHYKGKDLQSWMKYRFDLVTDLEPLFYEVYKYGGLYLSVVKDDIQGADYILEKGQSFFPNDFWINYYHAYNAQFELKDYKKAIRSYEKILHHSLTKEKFILIPSIYASLKIKKEKTNLKYALSLLEYSYSTMKNEGIKTRLKIKIEKIKQAIKKEN